MHKTPARNKPWVDHSKRSYGSSCPRSPKLSPDRPFIIKDLPSPITVFQIDYKGKSIIYPLYRDKQYLIDVLRPHIIKFEKKYFHQRTVVINWRTTDNNYILDYFLQKTTCFNQYSGQIIRIAPIFKVPQSKHPRLKDYQLIKCIGTGGFSRVYLTRKKSTGSFFAIKLMQKNYIYQNDRQLMIQSQRDIMSKVDNPFLVKLQQAFETKHFFAFVIQYCPGGQLFYLLRKIKRMTQEQAKFYFTQILLGINCLHQNGILYRDIKPENIIIDWKGHLKITDFGLSKICDIRSKSYSYVGSPQYMAPQMITQTGHTYLLDYYCLGALLYQLLIGIPPFYTQNRENLYSSILNQELIIEQDLLLSLQVKDFLHKLLKKNANQRLGTTQGILQLIEHPWFQSINIQDILQKKENPPFKPNLLALNYDQKDILEDDKVVWQKILQNPDQSNYRPPRQSWFQYRHKKDILKNLEDLQIKPKTSKTYKFRGLTTHKIQKPFYQPVKKLNSTSKDKHKFPSSPGRSTMASKQKSPKFKQTIKHQSSKLKEPKRNQSNKKLKKVRIKNL